MHEWGRQVSQLAVDTLVDAQADARLGFDAAYMPPEDYHHGPCVPPARGTRVRRVQRGMGGPRGRGGQRGRDPQQGGTEAPVEDISEDLSGEFGEAHDVSDNMPTFRLLSPGTSQLTLTALLLITSTTISSFDWDEYYPHVPGSSRITEARLVRDVQSGRCLSYGYASRDVDDPLGIEMETSYPVETAQSSSITVIMTPSLFIFLYDFTITYHGDDSV